MPEIVRAEYYMGSISDDGGTMGVIVSMALI
jgi:hypothetical protein